MADLYKTPPPEFGHPMHGLFGFDPEYVNLNHGAFGAVPKPVLAACGALTTQIESNPDYFLRLGYQPLLANVRQRIAHLIGADPDECVMVSNATLGIATVLRNFEWNHGDILVANNTTFPAISNALQYLSDVPPYPTVAEFILNFPMTHSDILVAFRNHLRSLPRPSGEQKVVAVVDSITSMPGVLMPWREMVQICKEEGVWSIVDAAHSIGHEVGINLAVVQPDFWISNCHKWLFAKRSATVLYVPKRNQHIIKTSVPTSLNYVSPSSGACPSSSFIKQFEWNGTIDFVPFLSVSAALDFRHYLGGEAKINAYCHRVAIAGGKRLAEVMGTRVMDPEGQLTLNMVNVELPLPGHIQPTEKIELMFKEKLLLDWNAYAAHYYHNGRWWTRCSAQVWTEIEDFEKLGKAFVAVCGEIEDAAKDEEAAVGEVTEKLGEVCVAVRAEVRGTITDEGMEPVTSKL